MIDYSIYGHISIPCANICIHIRRVKRFMKQACRENLVASFFPLEIFIPLYFSVLSHVKIDLQTPYFAPDLSSTLRSSVMEKFSVTYSTKNIPLPSQNDYLQRLIEKTEHFLCRMCWKAYFFLNPTTIRNTKDIYGFKSTKNPPLVEELKEFENHVLKMIQSTKFKHINSPFLIKIKDDAIKIKKETKLIIAADKTANFYKLEPSAYNERHMKDTQTKRHTT